MCPVHCWLGHGHTGGAGDEAGLAPQGEEAAILSPEEDQALRGQVGLTLKQRAAKYVRIKVNSKDEMNRNWNDRFLPDYALNIKNIFEYSSLSIII